MKRLFTALVILAALLCGSLYTGRQVSQMTEHCVRQLESAQLLAEQGDWTQARAITQQVFEDWEGHKFSLHALLRHDDTDQILLSFRAVEQYLLLEEMDQYAAANVTLITQLELLSEMEQPTVENVL